MRSSRFCACTKRVQWPHTECATCRKGAYRKEHAIRDALLSIVSHEPSCLDDTLFGTEEGCDVVKKRRPDIAWLGEDRVVIVEVDENGGHGTLNYTKECDFGWVMDISSAIYKIYSEKTRLEVLPHVIVIRFNPDEFDLSRETVKDRVLNLAEVVNRYLTIETLDSLYDNGIRVPLMNYMYYHTKCFDHILYALEKKDSVKVNEILPMNLKSAIESCSANPNPNGLFDPIRVLPFFHI